ncbi:MAG: beta-lactamase family protein [Scytonematopsis contorta HA4267-MV1]|nr:beta-lactamase family protein [Scytonematopsis contorta HA4267-MV1]
MDLKTAPILPHHFLNGGPGAAMAVAHRGEIIYSEVFGFADIEAQKQITTKSAFDLASVSKLFTATAIALLYERGILKLDALLSEFFPKFSIESTHRPILVQDLLWHTSGLVDYLELNSPDAISTLTVESVLEQLVEHIPKSVPGVSFNYSNTNYVLLAQIIEIMSGKSYEEFVTSEILKPLKLEKSFVLGSIRTPPHRVRGYTYLGLGKACYKINELDTVNILGDGSLFSTVEDLVRWQHALFHGEVVSKATLELMTARGLLDNGKQTDYGFGTGIENFDDGYLYSHGGGWAGTSTLVGYFLEKQMTFVFLSNLAGTPCGHIVHQLLSKLL